MAAAVGKLDRNAKLALAALVLIAAFILAMVVRTSVIAVTADGPIAAAGPQSEDELIEIGNHVLLLDHGSQANRIVHWLHAGSKSSRAFEVGEGSFVPNSPALTSAGERRVDTFADLMTHGRALDAQILLSTKQGNQILLQQRAQALRADLIHKGVQASHVAVSGEPLRNGTALSKDPELVVVLTA